MRIAILLVLLFTLSQHIHAQNDSTATKRGEGEVINGEIVIEKEKKIVLPKATKSFKKAELRSFSSEPLQLDFDIFQPSFEWPNYKSDVPFQIVNKEYPSADYQNYIKVGFGNYISPLIEARVFKDIDQVKISTALNHESFARGPINEDFSRTSLTIFDISAKYEAKSFSITPYLKVKNQQYNFYGNANSINTGFSSEGPDEVRYNKFSFGTLITAVRKAVNYNFDAKAINSSQRLVDGTNINKEPSIEVNAAIDVRIDTSFNAGFDLEAYSSNYQSGISYKRSLIQISPWVKYSRNQLSLKTGVRLGSSKSDDTKISGLFPFANAELTLKNDIVVSAYVGSGLNWVSLDQLIEKNEFLDDSLTISNQKIGFDVSLGVRKKITDKLNIDGRVHFQSSEFFPIYVASLSDSSRYTIIADDNSLDRTSLIAGFNYQMGRSLAIRTSMKYHLYSYQADFEGEPWHLPDFEFETNATYDFNEELIFSSSVNVVSGLSSPKYNEIGQVDLPLIFDLNFGVKYLITNRSSLFIEADNLLNIEYERYIGYPVRGIAFKIGGKYRF